MVVQKQLPHYKWDNTKLFVKKNVSKNSKIFLKVVVIPGATSNVSALETGGNFGIDGMSRGFAPDSVDSAGLIWGDISGNSSNATNVGATLTPDRFGRPNKAYLCDGGYLSFLQDSSILDRTVIIRFKTPDSVTLPDYHYVYGDSAFGIRHTYISNMIYGAFVLCTDNSTFSVNTNNTTQYPETYCLAVTLNSTNKTLNLFSEGQYEKNTMYASEKTPKNMQATGYIGRYSATFGDSKSIIYELYTFDRILNEDEISAVCDSRKYAPNLVVSEITELSTNTYRITVENTGATDYTDVQIVIPTEGTTMALATGFEVVEMEFENPKLQITSKPFSYSGNYYLSAIATDDTEISQVVGIQNGGTPVEMIAQNNVYMAKFALEDGTNTFTVVATDVFGNSTFRDIEVPYISTEISYDFTEESILSDLLAQFPHNYDTSEGSNIHKLMSAISPEIYALRKSTADLEYFQDPNLAIGYALDLLGSDVLQLRGIASDEQYRALIKMRRSIQTTSGTYNELVQNIANILNCNYSDVNIEFPNDEAMCVKITITPEQLLKSNLGSVATYQMLQASVPAGVRVVALVEGTLKFQETAGYDDFGFSDADGTLGGTFSAYLTDDGLELPID